VFVDAQSEHHVEVAQFLFGENVVEDCKRVEFAVHVVADEHVVYFAV